MRKELIRPWMIGVAALALIGGVAAAVPSIRATYIDTGTTATLTSNGSIIPATNNVGQVGITGTLWARMNSTFFFVPAGGAFDADPSNPGSIHIGDQYSTSIIAGRPGNNTTWAGNFAVGGILSGTAGTGSQTGKVPMTIYSDTTVTNSVTTGEIDGSTYTMPANTMTANGMQLHITAGWKHAANVNATTAKLYVNGVAIVNTSNSTSGDWVQSEIWAVRDTSSEMTYHGFSQNPNGAYVGHRGSVTGLAFGSSMIIKISVTGATTNGDLSTVYLRVEWWPN